MLTWAAQFPEHGDVSRVGVVGYCMSGPFALMAAAGISGTEHGFVFPQRPMYDKPSAERHWSRLHDLFRRNLL